MLDTLNKLWQVTFLDISLGRFAACFAVLVLALIGKRVLDYAFTKIFFPYAARTRNRFDDLLLAAVRKPAGLLGSLAAGVAFGAGWTPCVGPVLATNLLYAGMSGTMLHGALLLAVYAVGLGLPFFVAAVAFNWFLARTRSLRRWLVPIERAAGAVMVVAGALLFTGKFSLLSRLLAV